jgi:radical SAM superfamily enzyme YgiQ (UPF0313 family)
MMREAFFSTIFCGIETPDVDALHAMRKDHNAALPLFESIETLNSYGMEVVSGIILGLDTDTPETPARLLDFFRRSNIPMLTINLLPALPMTPLYERLAREGRICDDPERESNVIFRRPYNEVVAGWRDCIAEAYRPEELYRRFAHNLVHTYPNRITLPASPQRASWANMRRGFRNLANLLLRVGVLADYRRTFWATAKPLLKAGRIEDLIHVALVAHHLIAFTQDAVSGRQNASFYSAKMRERGAAAL